MSKKSKTQKEMSSVGEALKLASKHKLEVEVITFAFKAIKDNPALTIEEALEVGLGEWDI